MDHDKDVLMSAPGLQGLRPWIVQRISAVFIAVFILYFIIAITQFDQFDFEHWHGWLAWPGNNIVTETVVNLF